MLNIIFPTLMVIGAFGSMVVEMIHNGFTEVTIQWMGAMLLYMALTIRNIK